jgi:hypothetical protein
MIASPKIQIFILKNTENFGGVTTSCMCHPVFNKAHNTLKATAFNVL